MEDEDAANAGDVSPVPRHVAVGMGCWPSMVGGRLILIPSFIYLTLIIAGRAG